MLVTIFTPAYNRGHLLNRLYKSLLVQTMNDFEWVIVDDGSIDETEIIVKEFIEENIIKITYYKQTNSGKHIAINNGVGLAKGELFFIVDSDDFLTPNSLEKVKEKYLQVKDKPDFAGVAGRKGYSETEFIGSKDAYSDIFASALEFRYKYNKKGDMAEVVKTSVLKEFLFPVIPHEKFCTEGLVWFRIAKKYKMLWFSEIIYIAEYLEGGLSNNIFKVRKNSPQYATLFYSELERMDIPLLQKLKSNINFWRFAKFINEPISSKYKRVNPLFSIFGLPVSLIFLFKDRE